MELIETWKDIDGYEEKYQISNYGRLKSIKKDLVMKPMIATNGYLVACLWKDNKQRKFGIHRLVAQHFIDNPHNYKEVNHIDENKTNNMVNNLEWCDHKKNINYGTCKERISASQINHPKHSKVTYQYSKNGELIQIWPSASEVERQLGYCARVICNCRSGKGKTAYGYLWKSNMEEIK